VDYTFGITTHLYFLVSKWIPDVLSHSKLQDTGQVRDHYDRGTIHDTDHHLSPSNPFTGDGAEDDFFGMFLGERMIYTSGISSLCGHLAQPPPPQSTAGNASGAKTSGKNKQHLKPHNETLEQMQDNKLRLVCKKLNLSKGDTHLDIGCGWGTLVNYSARKHGTVATGVTLSRNQVVYASSISRKLGISNDQARFMCMDYRDIPTDTGIRCVFSLLHIKTFFLFFHFKTLFLVCLP
jgi:hypothetical protein